MSRLAKAARGRWSVALWMLVSVGVAGANAAYLVWSGATSWPSQGAAMFHGHPPQFDGPRSAAKRSLKHGSGSTPQLLLSAARLNLRDGKPSEIVRGQLTLSNRGSSPADFSLFKHCGCTELSPMSGTLPPGANQTIRVAVQLPDHANSEKKTSIDVLAGEPANIVASCVISVRCPAPFHVTPASVSFGSLSDDKLALASRRIRLDPVDGRQLALDRLRWEHHDDAFELDIIPAPDSGPSAGSIFIRVSLNGRMSRGDHYDTLELHLLGSDYVMRVPLDVRRAQKLAVVPATIVLRTAADNHGFEPVTFLLLSRVHSFNLGGVTLIDAPLGVGIDDLGMISDGRRRLRLSVTADAAAWPEEIDIQMRVDGADEPLWLTLKKSS